MQVDSNLAAKTQENETNEAPISPLRKWGSLIVMSFAVLIIVIDTTLLNVSLANIIRDLGTDIQSLQWVITAYSLTLAALTVTGGRLGDMFGRKRMFMLGAIIFAVGSFIASISTNFPTLLAGESIIEGIGAALMMPATSALLVANFKGRDRALAFGVWGGVAAGGAAIGPILGGYLASNFSWRWGFRINVFVTILLLIGSVLIKKDRPSREKPSLDWTGVFLSAIGLLSIVFGVIEASTYGWWKATQVFSIFGQNLDLWGYSITPFAILIGVIITALFVVWEIHVEKAGRKPIVSMKLFKNRQFSSGMLTTAIMSLGQAGIIFSIPVFLQSVRGLDAYNTGLALLPLSISLLVAAPLSAVISKKISPKRLVQFGLLLDIIAMIIIQQSFSVNADAWTFAPGLAIYGIGMGLIMAQVSNLALSAVPVHEAGEASGVNSTLRQMGASFGSAIIGAAMLTALATNITAGINDNQHIPSLIKPYLEQTVSAQTSNVEFGGGAQIKMKLPTSIKLDIHNVSEQAIADANKSSVTYGIFFAILGFLASFMLPNIKLSGPKSGPKLETVPEVTPEDFPDFGESLPEEAPATAN